MPPSASLPLAAPAADGGRAPAAPAAATTTGEGLSGALLGYLVAVVFVITVWPFDFRWPDAPRLRYDEWSVLDVAANVLLFVPLGFLYRQARSGASAALRGRGMVGHVLLLGGAVSLAIEAAQLLIPERYSSPWDVLANAAGAALGAFIAERAERRLDVARVVDRLGLELPLMGLVYLLVPLGWLSAIGFARVADRWPALLCLGLVGGSVLGAAQRRHFGPSGLFSAPLVAAAASGWLVLCALPALTTRAPAVLAIALGTGAFTWHRAVAGSPDGDRRFELATLLRASPYFAAYLLLLALADPPGLPGTARFAILHLVETTSAFALVGYMIAESRGRRELPYRRVAPAIALIAFLAAIAVAAFRGAAGASSVLVLPGAGPAVVAAVYGGWLYHLQRDRVRALLGARG